MKRCTDLYFFQGFGTLPRSAVATAAQRPGVAQSIERVARAVRGLLHARGATRGLSALSAGAAQRQPPQVDERDAGTRPRSRHVSGLPAFHHRCAVVGRRGVAPAARHDSRSHRRADSRWHELPEAGAILGWRGAAVLRRAGQDRQLSNRGDGGVVDRGTRVDARRDLVSARGLADARRSGRARAFRLASARNRNGSWRSRCSGRSARAASP